MASQTGQLARLPLPLPPLLLLLLLLLLLPCPAQSDWAALDAAGVLFSQQCSKPKASPLLCSHAPAPPAGLAPLAPAAAAAAAPLLHAAWGLAEAQSGMRRHAAAAALRAACLSHANASASASAALPWASPAAAHAALAHDLRHSRDYPAALAAVQAALRGAPPASPTAAALQAFQAELLSCSGGAHAVEALAALARAKRAAAAAGGAGDEASAALQELDLLRRALRAPALPPALARGLAAKYQRLVAGMLAAGPWRDPLQLPRHFAPALLALPWHSVAGEGAGAALPEGWPSAALARAAAALSAAAPALLSEYTRLRDGGHLEPETECIAEPLWAAAGEGAGSGGGSGGGGGGGGARGARGDWRVFTATAFWLRPLDRQGCSVLSPVACGLRSALGALGLRVRRVGYSALWPGAQLHPHYGLSNGVLKLHVGVRVPAGGSGAPCAALTVGNETRHWQQGGVLAFDDSFLHSVAFDEGGGCAGGGERVVLQVVVAHPQAAGGEEQGS
jgi:hypothetical protein